MNSPNISVSRALSIIEFLAQNKLPVGATVISRAVQCDRTTVYALLDTLSSLGYVCKINRSGYVITDKLQEIVRGYNLNTLLISAFDNATWGLSKTSSCLFSIFVGNSNHTSIILLKTRGAAKNNDILRYPGSSFPLHATASGKVHLAFWEKAITDSYWDDSTPLRQVSAYTNVDKAKLREEVRRVRKLGWARDNGEMQFGSCCIAVPVLSPDGSLICSLSAHGPYERIKNSEKILIEKMKKAANIMSDELYGSVKHPKREISTI